MSPSFQEIWVGEWIDQWSHSRNYFRIRSAVRIALWAPITVYLALGLTGWYL